MELLIWAGKVSIYWLLLYGCFHFFLRKLTYFQANRFYLLAALLLPIVLPFLKLPKGAIDSFADYAILLEPVSIFPEGNSSQSISWLQILGIIYFSLVALRLFRLGRKINTIRQVWKSALLVSGEEDRPSIYLLSDNRTGSFSFFNRIAISPADYENHFDEILSHEMVHVTQRHSFDVLLVEILSAIFWFHPILPAYKRSLQEIHEFLADQKIRDRDIYADFLVSYALGLPKTEMVNAFYNSSLLKLRIQMLYQTKSPKWKFVMYPLTILITTILVVFVAACSEAPKTTGDLPGGENLLQAEVVKDGEILPPPPPPPVEMPGKDTEITDGKIFTAVEEQPKFPGGITELYRYLSKNTRYPAAASRSGVEGTVFLQFVVRADGSITDVVVLKGIGFGCEEEAMRVVKAMPKWLPGKQTSIPVNAKYTLPINFELGD